MFFVTFVTFVAKPSPLPYVVRVISGQDVAVVAAANVSYTALMAETGNLIEGILWSAIALGFVAALLKPGWRSAKIVAAINFAAFGVSDFIEMQTGAWWRPWWLLAWKAACVAVMAAQLVLYVRRKRKLTEQ